jgi:hypothetical protein
MLCRAYKFYKITNKIFIVTVDPAAFSHPPFGVFDDSEVPVPMSRDPQSMTGARVLVEMLQARGVKVLFGVPGGTSVPLRGVDLEPPVCSWLRADGNAST